MASGPAADAVGAAAAQLRVVIAGADDGPSTGLLDRHVADRHVEWRYGDRPSPPDDAAPAQGRMETHGY